MKRDLNRLKIKKERKLHGEKLNISFSHSATVQLAKKFSVLSGAGFNRMQISMYFLWTSLPSSLLTSRVDGQVKTGNKKYVSPTCTHVNVFVELVEQN